MLTKKFTDESVPELHLNIQIHISPDAPEEQIDQIFAAMAKHLGRECETVDGTGEEVSDGS